MSINHDTMKQIKWFYTSKQA